MESLYFRHATKQFDPQKKITDEDFQIILEAGRLSPSSIGIEPWKFLVIQDSALRTKLKEVTWGAQGQLPTASHFVIILARTIKDTKYGSEYMRKHMKEVKNMPDDVFERALSKYKSFQESDLRLLESERTMLDWAGKQTYIALGSMMTVAALMGIDSCPIEGFDFAAVQTILEEQGLLDDGHLAISVMVAFGYRVQEPRPKTRKPQKDVVQYL